MDTTANLSLPLLAPAQAQKHVTVNEALLRLDAVAQLAVTSFTLAAEPGDPLDGALYILPPGKTGVAWDAMADHAVAHYHDGAWAQITPRAGWLAADPTGTVRTFTGGAWQDLPFLPLYGGALTENVLVTIAASASGFPGLIFRRSGDVGRSLVFGFDGANRRAFFNRWDTATDGYLENLLTIGQDGVVDFVGVATPQVKGADVYHAGATPRPAADNVHSLGAADARFAQAYVASGVIQTSDAREKTPLTPPSDALARAGRRLAAAIGVYQWREAVAAKGADGARRHLGLTAQAVAAAFHAEGLDPQEWGLFCADPAPREDEDAAEDAAAAHADAPRLGLRMDQVLLVLILAYLTNRKNAQD